MFIATDLVVLGTLLALKKGYIRYSIRNAFMFYMTASYIACPENLNPFWDKLEVNFLFKN